MYKTHVLSCIGLLTASLVSAARGVVVYGDPAAAPATHRLTSQPSGDMAPTWQYVGTFGSGGSRYIGIPIAPNYFITANHVAGSVGTTLTLPDGAYPVTAGSYHRLGTTDLAVFHINGTFAHYAPLYHETTDGDLTGKQLLVYGRGKAPGSAIDSVPPGYASPITHNGWTWGAIDGVVSWGTNNVDGKAVDASLGQFITFSPSTSGGSTEGALVDKDSGGGVFAKGAGGQWKLAGINYGVGPQSYYTVSLAAGVTSSVAWIDSLGGYYYVNAPTSTGGAAIFDTSNLFLNDHTTGGITFYNPGYLYTANGLQQDYASSISDNWSAINAVIPEPTSLLLLVVPGTMFGLRRRSGGGVARETLD